MNYIVSISLVAAVTAALTQPLHADQNHRGGGGHAAAPAHVSAPIHASAPRAMPSAPRTAMHAPRVAPSVPRTAQVPRAATQSQALFADRVVNPKQVHPQIRQTPAIAQRNIQRQRNVPSIAFGGSVPQGSARMEGTDTPRRIENRPATVAASVARGRDFKPPLGIYRNWEHGRVHEWNHHHYRWSGGDWVIIDGGGFATPDYYETAPADSYSYGTSGVIENGGAADVLPNGDATPGASRDLTAQVQEQLSRRGYDPGPVDGVMGLQTRDAIEDFQSAFGMPINGQIDSSLLQALGL